MEPRRVLNRAHWTVFVALLLFSLLAAWMPGDSFAAHPCDTVPRPASRIHCPDIDKASCCYWYSCDCHCCEKAARFSSVSGQVEYYPDGDPKNRMFVKMNTVLYVGDHVITGEDSTTIVSFADLSTFLLKPESEIVIIPPPSQGSKIGLLLGNIWVNVKKMMKDGSMEIDMSQVAASVKGTTLVLEETKTSSTVKVLEGVVTVTPKHGGAPVSVKAGQMVVAKAGTLSPIGSLNVAGETARWQPLLTTASLSTPVPVQPVQKFNNYNGNVACSYTDKATFILKEPIHVTQAALWYDFGGTQNVTYTLMASGQKIGSGTVKKGDCAAGYTWCHGFIELGDLGPGTYTVVAAPARVCHNVKHDAGNGFIMISGVPKK